MFIYLSSMISLKFYMGLRVFINRLILNPWLDRFRVISEKLRYLLLNILVSMLDKDY